MTNKQSPVVSPMVHFCRVYRLRRVSNRSNLSALQNTNHSRSPSDRFRTALRWRGDQLANGPLAKEPLSKTT